MGLTVPDEPEGFCGRKAMLCGSRGGRVGLTVPDEPEGFCGRKAMLCGSRGGRVGLTVPDEPEGFRGRKAAFLKETSLAERKERGKKRKRLELGPCLLSK